jgi:hypothetical protein
VLVSDDSNLQGAFKIGGSHLLRFALKKWKKEIWRNLLIKY